MVKNVPLTGYEKRQLQLIELLENQVPEDRFRMDYFKHPRGLSLSLAPECRTAGCIAGWASTLFPLPSLGFGIGAELAGALGFRRGDPEYLPIVQLCYDFDIKTPKEAAARLREILGGCVSPLAF